MDDSSTKSMAQQADGGWTVVEHDRWTELTMLFTGIVRPKARLCKYYFSITTI